MQPLTEYLQLLVVPIQASQACLMLDTPPNANVPSLTDEQRAGCSKIFTRSYNTIDQGYEWNTAGDLVMIARVGVDTALMNKNVTMRAFSLCPLKGKICDADGSNHSEGSHEPDVAGCFHQV